VLGILLASPAPVSRPAEGERPARNERATLMLVVIVREFDWITVPVTRAEN
jgi:hypothetical protein